MGKMKSNRLLQGLYLYVALSIGVFMGFVGTYNYFPQREFVPMTQLVTVTRTVNMTMTEAEVRVFFITETVVSVTTTTTTVQERGRVTCCTRDRIMNVTKPSHS